MAKNYTAKRRSEQAEYDTLQTLSVEFAGFGRDNARQAAGRIADLGEVLCFERKRDSSSLVVQDFPTSATMIAEQAHVSKKRKLRDGRSIQLDKLFENF